MQEKDPFMAERNPRPSKFKTGDLIADHRYALVILKRYERAEIDDARYTYLVVWSRLNTGELGTIRQNINGYTLERWYNKVTNVFK